MQYERLAQNALRGVVRMALERAAEPAGLPGEHQLFISFSTQANGVQLPARLLHEYPTEMTIVIKQHYWDLEIHGESFAVDLSFNGQRERIHVPYKAVTRFVDPIASFGLEFPDPMQDQQMASIADPIDEPNSNVVRLDKFRKR